MGQRERNPVANAVHFVVNRGPGTGRIFLSDFWYDLWHPQRQRGVWRRLFSALHAGLDIGRGMIRHLVLLRWQRFFESIGELARLNPETAMVTAPVVLVLPMQGMNRSSIGKCPRKTRKRLSNSAALLLGDTGISSSAKSALRAIFASSQQITLFTPDGNHAYPLMDPEKAAAVKIAVAQPAVVPPQRDR
jgi:hypothetical protein